MQTYFEKDFVRIGYDETNQIMIVEWKIPPTSQEFRNSMSVLIVLAQVRFTDVHIYLDITARL